jgi:hypothetical protein
LTSTSIFAVADVCGIAGVVVVRVVVSVVASSIAMSIVSTTLPSADELIGVDPGLDLKTAMSGVTCCTFCDSIEPEGKPMWIAELGTC